MSATIRALCAGLPPEEIIRDPDIMASFSRDQAGLCEAGHALAVVVARSVASVQHTLRVANEYGVPVVPRGAGTGLSGGANALPGCVVLSLAKLDAILEVDPTARLARVQPGVLNAALDSYVREHGLMYAPDPASREISTIGGNIATNAGGACCLKYGVTGDHIAQLQAVLADGSLIRTGSRSVKNVAGLDLQRLLIGSEGTLAVIVEATTRLLPRRPACGTLVAFFGSLHAAGEAIVALQGPRCLSKLEVMDQTTVSAVEAMVSMGLDTQAAAMVLAQSDTADAADIMRDCQQLCEAHGATFVTTTLDETEGRMFMRARSAALPALEKRGQCLLDDVAVSVPQLPALLNLCAEAAARHGVLIGTFGHAGDGNLHPTLVFNTDAERGQALAAFADIIEGTLALGGTVTGEHGVGVLKRPFLEQMVGARELALMRGVKQAFDPMGILNPGKAF